jgi:hypothetical protein
VLGVPTTCPPRRRLRHHAGGRLCRRPALRPDGREIERVLEVPLRALLDPAAYREEQWERDGALHPVTFVTYGDDVIWGVTARILRGFLDLVFGETPRWTGR